MSDIDFKGLVPVGDHQIYAEYKRPAEGFPTLVLLNGLSDNTESWTGFLSHLSSPDYGFLRFDFRGQGRSLEWELRANGSFERNVTVDEQADDLEYLLRHFQIPRKYDLVGTSYGGGVALRFASTRPSEIDKLILFVPYLIRLDQAHPLQRTWAQQFEMMRGMGWLGQGAYESVQRWYQQFLTHYMDHRYHRVVPDPDLRNATIHLTFGIMSYNGFKSLPDLPPRSLHLVSVGRDTLVPRTLYSEMWYQIPPSIKESWLYIEDGEHLILDQCPAFCARWTEMIMAGDPRLCNGARFRGQAYSFEVRDENFQPVQARI